LRKGTIFTGSKQEPVDRFRQRFPEIQLQLEPFATRAVPKRHSVGDIGELRRKFAKKGSGSPAANGSIFNNGPSIERPFALFHVASIVASSLLFSLLPALQ
jgi:hypothetical protein